jgi:hypothetical protein
MENRKIFICQCHSLEHQYAFWYDEDQKFIYCEPHLITNKSFLGRIFHAIKYIFGYKTRFGSWDEFIFKKEDIKRLKEILDKIDLN